MGSLHKVSDKKLSEWIKEVESEPPSNDNAAPSPSKPPRQCPTQTEFSEWLREVAADVPNLSAEKQTDKSQVS